jgi:hypothetical protein
LFVWRHKRLAGIGILYQPTLVVAPWIGDGFCCWFMIDLLYNYRSTWSVAAASRLGQVESMGSMILFQWLTFGGAAVLVPQFFCDSHLEFRNAAGTFLWPVMSYIHSCCTVDTCVFEISSYHLPND